MNYASFGSQDELAAPPDYAREGVQRVLGWEWRCGDDCSGRAREDWPSAGHGRFEIKVRRRERTWLGY